jgi:hypothetical protein
VESIGNLFLKTLKLIKLINYKQGGRDNMSINLVTFPAVNQELNQKEIIKDNDLNQQLIKRTKGKENIS